MKFPLSCDGLDGRTREFVSAINEAFYTGYMLALCSKEEYGRLTAMDRIALMVAAKIKADKIL